MTHGAGARTLANGCNPRGATLSHSQKWSDLRTATGLSLREYRDATGINRGDLSKIERGIAAPAPWQAAAILAVYSGHR